MADDKKLINNLLEISSGVATSNFDLEIKKTCKQAAMRLKELIGAGRMAEDELTQKLRALVEAGNAPEHILSLCDNAANYIAEMHETLDYARALQAENIRLTMELVKKQSALDAAIRDFKIIESYKSYPRENRPCAVCKNIDLYCSSGGASCKGFEWRGVGEALK